RSDAEGNPPAQEVPDRDRPQAGVTRCVSQALFPAWRPTDGEAARLAPVAAALREASREHGLRLGSLRRPDQWHVTLCFVGNGVRHLATPALRASFERVAACMPPHSFRFERIMYWPKGVVVARSEEHTSEL